MGRCALLVLIVLCRLTFSQTASGPQGAVEKTSATAQALARAQSAALERNYGQAIKILRSALKNAPDKRDLQLELGRDYLELREDSKAQRLFTSILTHHPEDRSAQLELARVLAFQGHFKESDALYRRLLSQDAADEAAAIGLTSNLLHENETVAASEIVNDALRYHPDSLRLLEYRDRIARGVLGSDERAVPALRNSISSTTDYINDSGGNHAWRNTEQLQIRLKPEITSDLNLEQQLLHRRDAPLTVVQAFSESLRWRPVQRIGVTAGGGALIFDTGRVNAIYETTLTSQITNHFLAGAGFSRIPVTPDAEAAEHRITAQGWDSFALWSTQPWQVTLRASRRHYSDGNVGDQEFAEIIRQWNTPKIRYVVGYRFRHYGFSEQLANGYFSPDDYRNHQISAGLVFHPNRVYRAEFSARAGAESITSTADYAAAWEINARNQLVLGRWELGLDYAKYHMAQATGAFKADAGRFELSYHF